MSYPSVKPRLTFKSMCGLLLRSVFHFCRDTLILVRNWLKGKPKHYLCLTALVKNEAPYIREWIEYHRIVGVEKFFIYDNESNDHLEAVLDPYVRAGLVVLTPWLGKAQQLAIYNYALRKFGHETHWMGVIDVDEFLYPVAGDSIADIMKECETCSGIVANWYMFDSSGHKTKPPGLVVESYRHRQLLHHRLVKTIFRPAYFSHFFNPHTPRMIFGRFVLNQSREPQFTPHNYNFSNEQFCIFHYWTKSRDEFVAKIERGTSIGEARNFEQDKHMLVFDRFEVEMGMDRFIPELKRRLGRHCVAVESKQVGM